MTRTGGGSAQLRVEGWVALAGVRRRLGGAAVALSFVSALVGGAAWAQGRALPVDRQALDGAIAGRACRDANSDGACQSDEEGMPGLRLVLETGQEVTTDAMGRYHLAAVTSRFEAKKGGIDLLPGRHRLRADPRGLLPGARVFPEAVTIEVPVSGLALQNFAVQEPRASVTEARTAYAEAPPSATMTPAREVAFLATGRAAPGDAVTVDGVAATVDPDGTYRASVPLHPGANELSIQVAAPDGGVRLYAQRIDVVARPSGALIIPRTLRPTARVQLPGSVAEPASAGSGRVRVEGPKGTVVGHPGGQVMIGESGAVDVPVELTPGANTLPLSIQRPGEAERHEQLEVQARARPFVVGLLDAELGYVPGSEAGASLTSQLRLTGRGAAHGELPFGKWKLVGELDLRDQDVRDVFPLNPSGSGRDFKPSVLIAPRDPLGLERALDPERTPWIYADRSTSIVPNEAGGRVRLELAHPDFGGVGFGTFRAQFADTEIGRYHRELFGAWARVHTPTSSPVTVSAEGFASNGNEDPATGVVTRPAHAEFLATGGSLFYLPHPFVSRGSERVRIVVRDGLTAVPVSEQHLVRGVDYEVDAASGRILLAQPLSFARALPMLSTDWPTNGAEPVLVVDYEYVSSITANRPAAGGNATAKLGPVSLSAGGVGEGIGSEQYHLVRGAASVKLGGLELSAEAAQSHGRAHLPEDVTISSSGGLDFVSAATSYSAPWTDPDGDGWALGVRLRGETFKGGTLDAAWRRRTPSFSDETYDARGPLSQLSATVEQPLGPVVVGVVGDDRTVVDPRDPFGRTEVGSRTLGGYVGYRGETLEARVEAKDADLTEDVRAPEGDRVEGGRTSVGASVRYRLTPGLWLAAGHRQNLFTRGSGIGAFNDTFSQAGVDVALGDRTQLGVRGGWGPRTGPLAWVTGQYSSGSDTFYGSYSVDVDGPDFGERKAVSGARTTIADGTTVFVEDVGAHDATSVRLSRAVGLSYEVAPGLSVSARYERGTKSPLDILSPLRRDAGGVSAEYVRDRLRLYGRGEIRFDRGHDVLTPLSAPELDRVQRVASAAATFDALSNLQLGGRLNYSDTYDHDRRVARLLEASTGLSWRIDPAMVVVHYSVQRELSPVRPELGESVYQRLSVMPSLKLGDRFALAAGAHAGWFKVAGDEGTVLSASLRPSVRVVAGLELAAEIARRSAAPDGGELNSVRGEIGYRFGEDLMLAGGYTVYGYSGLGLTPDAPDAQRLYLRAEAAW